MRLKSLEIKGFKSFADKTVVSFDEGITGIIGPNGCGKSNIIDSIRWVIGEQKISSLRSENLDALVFNGSKTRSASGLAEVSLTFENTKNLLPTEFSTVTVTRRFYKNGESEYRLNDVSCRLKDIHNLFLDTGVSTDSYAIIELGYTVNQHLADLYYQKYQVEYQVIRNISFSYSLKNIDNEQINKFVLYQGAVNLGRCFEQLIPAMKIIDIPLVIAGEGNFLEETKDMVRRYDVANKVQFKGRLAPLELRELTQRAYIGLTLFEAKGANQYYSLANRFFDYMMAGIPQVCVNYPEYAQINDQYQFAYLIPDTKPETIAQAINNLLTDAVLYQQLRSNCLNAREILNWQNEEHKLLNFYSKLTRE